MMVMIHHYSSSNALIMYMTLFYIFIFSYVVMVYSKNNHAIFDMIIFKRNGVNVYLITAYPCSLISSVIFFNLFFFYLFIIYFITMFIFILIFLYVSNT